MPDHHDTNGQTDVLLRFVHELPALHHQKRILPDWRGARGRPLRVALFGT